MIITTAKKEEIALEIMNAISDGTSFALCENCPAVTLDRGITISGLRAEPDELSCPCDFELGERGCVKKEIYETIKERVGEIAELLADEMEAAR